MQQAEMKVTRFSNEDVIATSGNGEISAYKLRAYSTNFFGTLYKLDENLINCTDGNTNYVDAETVVNTTACDGSNGTSELIAGYYYHASGQQPHASDYVGTIWECKNTSHHQ